KAPSGQGRARSPIEECGGRAIMDRSWSNGVEPRALRSRRRRFVLDTERIPPGIWTMPEFTYQEPFPLGPDPTRYRLLTEEFVSTGSFEGREILNVAPEALTLLAREAFREVSFYYRESHLAKVAAILDDPEAS